MAKELGQYDTALQMFVEKPKPLNESRLRFMRWLGEHGKLEHPVAGPPAGEVAMAIVIRTNRPVEEIMHPKSINEARAERNEQLRQRIRDTGDY